MKDHKQSRMTKGEERSLRPWHEVARLYRQLHPQERMSRSVAFKIGHRAIGKLRQALEVDCVRGEV